MKTVGSEVAVEVVVAEGVINKEEGNLLLPKPIVLTLIVNPTSKRRELITKMVKKPRVKSKRTAIRKPTIKPTK